MHRESDSREGKEPNQTRELKCEDDKLYVETSVGVCVCVCLCDDGHVV